MRKNRKGPNWSEQEQAVLAEECEKYSKGQVFTQSDTGRQKYLLEKSTGAVFTNIPSPSPILVLKLGMSL